jgi:tetratricopeptide (TPR) repeat protein
LRDNNRGLVYLDKQNYERAIADFDAALLLNPKMAKALYARGVARIRSGDVLHGNADIAAARSIEPHLPRIDPPPWSAR